jgi:hypothetical protein
MSVVQAISRNKNTGEITGFSDERKYPGKAMFYWCVYCGGGLEDILYHENIRKFY